AAAAVVGAAALAAALVAAAVAVGLLLPPQAARSDGTMSASSAIAATRRNRSVRFIVASPFHQTRRNETSSNRSTRVPHVLLLSVFLVTIPANSAASRSAARFCAPRPGARTRAVIPTKPGGVGYIRWSGRGAQSRRDGRTLPGSDSTGLHPPAGRA